MKVTTPDMLATALKEARANQSMTQQDVAQLVGIKQATVSALENRPEKSRVETLFRLLAALGLELQVTQRDQAQKQAWNEEW